MAGELPAVVKDFRPWSGRLAAMAGRFHFMKRRGPAMAGRFHFMARHFHFMEWRASGHGRKRATCVFELKTRVALGIRSV